MQRPCYQAVYKEQDNLALHGGSGSSPAIPPIHSTYTKLSQEAVQDFAAADYFQFVSQLLLKQAEVPLVTPSYVTKDGPTEQFS